MSSSIDHSLRQRCLLRPRCLVCYSEVLSITTPISSFTLMPAILSELVPLCSQSDLERLRGAPFPWCWRRKGRRNRFSSGRHLKILRTSTVRAQRKPLGLSAFAERMKPVQRRNGLQVISGLMGALEKAQLSDSFGQLVICGTVKLIHSPCHTHIVGAYIYFLVSANRVRIPSWRTISF